MLPAAFVTTCPALAVPAAVMQSVVQVESGANPYAIGVVGARLERQPRTLDEALATVQMLESKGHDYSLGIAQVNRANLGRYGLDSYRKAFEICPNLQAASQIMAGCYAQSGADWGKAFSCYYSGNFVAGFRDGYVQKIYASLDQPVSAAPIPLLDGHASASPSRNGNVPLPTDSPGYRIAIRSTTPDAAVSSPVTPGVAGIGQPMVAAAMSATTPSGAATPHFAAATDPGIFVPQVRGPFDPSPTAGHAINVPAAASRSPLADTKPSSGGHDDAFVF